MPCHPTILVDYLLIALFSYLMPEVAKWIQVKEKGGQSMSPMGLYGGETLCHWSVPYSQNFLKQVKQ